MSETAIREQVAWVRFATVVICLALVVLMAFAMFSTRSASYGTSNQDESYGPAEQFEALWKDVGKGVHRGAGEVL